MAERGNSQLLHSPWERTLDDQELRAFDCVAVVRMNRICVCEYEIEGNLRGFIMGSNSQIEVRKISVIIVTLGKSQN